MPNRKPAPAAPAEPRTDWELTVPEPIIPGLYDAHVTGVELRTAEADGREWLSWHFVLADGRTVDGGSSFSVSARTKGYAWIVAVVGRRAMGGGETITADTLVGHPCTVSVTDDAEGFPKVDAVLPPRDGHKPESPSIAELADELPA